MTSPTRQEPPLARLVGRRPQRGASDAAKEVVSDVQRLLRAEIDLAKAEVAEGAKAKAMGAGFFIVAAVVGWLAIHAFLVFLGFVFATFMPGWAAAGLVLLLLVIVIGILGFLGVRKLKQEASLSETKASVEASKQAATRAVERAKSNANEGVEEARGTVLEAVADVKERLSSKVAALRGGAAEQLSTLTSETPESSDIIGARAPGAPPALGPEASPVEAVESADGNAAADDTVIAPQNSLRPPSAHPAVHAIRFPDPPRRAEESQS